MYLSLVRMKMQIPGIVRKPIFVASKFISIPVTGRVSLQGCEKLRFPNYLDNWRSQMAVWLSVLRADRPLPAERSSGIHFC
jgi:hypothetical protein